MNSYNSKYRKENDIPGPPAQAPPPQPQPQQQKEFSHELLWLGSYIVLLVLAPLMQEGIEYNVGERIIYFSAYLPLLAAALPVLLAAYLVRPTSRVFFVAAPLLPVAMYFSLQSSTKHPLLLLFVLLSFCGLPFYHVYNASKPQEDPSDAEGETWRGERHVDRETGRRPRRKGASRSYWRKALTFGVVFMTSVLLIPAVLGVVLPEPAPPVIAPKAEEVGLENALVQLGKPWPAHGKTKERNDILQAVLAWECLHQRIDPICSIDDDAVRAITVDGKRAVLLARNTGEDQLQMRVELICYIAKIQKLRGPADEKGRLARVTNTMRSDARLYAEMRAPFYLDQVQVEG